MNHPEREHLQALDGLVCRRAVFRGRFRRTLTH